MLRRPSYKQFLNQTIAVQSSIHLPANENVPLMARTTGEGEIRAGIRDAREGRVLEVVKYLPNDPLCLRHTYKGAGRAKDEASCSFKATSPARIIPRPQERSTHGNRSEWRPSWKDPHDPTPLQRPPKQPAPTPPTPIHHCPPDKSPATLFQSKSSTRLGADCRIDKQTKDEREAGRRKEATHGRIAENANFPRNAMEKNTKEVAPYGARGRTTKARNGQCRRSGSRQRICDSRPSSSSANRTAGLKTPGKKLQCLPTSGRPPPPSPLSRPRSPSPRSPSTPSATSPVPVSARAPPSATSSWGKKLGEGRFGVVFMAIHIQTGAIFALKKIPKASIRSNLMVEQFVLEAKVQSYF